MPHPSDPSRLAPLLAASIGLLVALSGCSAPAPEPTATETRPAASAEPEPEPEPATSRPALDELVIGPTGIGELVIGEPLPQVDPELSIVRWDPEWCVGRGSGDLTAGDPAAGRWVPAYNEPPFALLVHEGVVHSIESYEVTTSTGIRVGSSRTELEAAYPSFDARVASEHTDMYVLDGATSRLVIEVMKEDGKYTPADHVAHVYAEANAHPLHSYIPGHSLLFCD